MDPGASLVIELEGLARLVGALGDRGFLVIGPTVRSGAIVYDVLDSADELPDRAAPTCRSRAATGSSGATTRPVSATPSGRSRGSESCCRPSCSSGGREREPDGGFVVAPDARRAAAARVHRRPRAASCTRSRSRTGAASAARTPTTTTRRAGATRSSSRSTAARPAAPASASRCRPGRRSGRATTSRSPSCSTRTATASWSRSEASAAPRSADELPSPARRARDREAAARAVERRRVADGPHAGHRRAAPSCCSATASTRAGRRSPTAA